MCFTFYVSPLSCTSQVEGFKRRHQKICISYDIYLGQPALSYIWVKEYPLCFIKTLKIDCLHSSKSLACYHFRPDIYIYHYTNFQIWDPLRAPKSTSDRDNSNTTQPIKLTLIQHCSIRLTTTSTPHRCRYNLVMSQANHMAFVNDQVTEIKLNEAEKKTCFDQK